MASYYFNEPWALIGQNSNTKTLPLLHVYPLNTDIRTGFVNVETYMLHELANLYILSEA